MLTTLRNLAINLCLLASASLLAASMIVLLSACFGLQFGGEPLLITLSIGIFAVLIPLGILVRASDPEKVAFVQKQMTKRINLFCIVAVLYIVASFLFGIFQNTTTEKQNHPSAQKTSGTQPSDQEKRGPDTLKDRRIFSGFWVLFYGLEVALALILRRCRFELPRCGNGHYAEWGARCCPQCGVELDRR